MSKENQADATAQDKTNKAAEEDIKKRLQKINDLVIKLLNEKLSEKEQEALLEEIRGILSKLIDAMQRRPSYLTRLAQYWGNFPMWQKIIAGIILTAPPLALGIALHVGILLAIFCMALLIYTGGGILLTDHDQQNTASTEHVKQGVNSLVDLFSTLIITAKTLCDTLKEQIEILTKENLRLQTLNNEFCAKVSEFSEQTALLEGTTKLLGIDVTTLSQEANKLTDHVAKTEVQKNILQEILNGYTKLYKGTIKSQQKIEELTKTIDTKQNQIQELSNTIKRLSAQIVQLSGNYRMEKQEFGDKITNELHERTESIQVLGREVNTLSSDVKESTAKLIQFVQSDFNSNARQLVNILNTQGLKPEFQENATKIFTALQKHGLFALNQNIIQKNLSLTSTYDSTEPSQ